MALLLLLLCSLYEIPNFKSDSVELFILFPQGRMSLILGLRVMTILTKRVLVYIEIVEISCPSPECTMYNLLHNGGDLCCGVSLSLSFRYCGRKSAVQRRYSKGTL
jgi:hypothetical protein